MELIGFPEDVKMELYKLASVSLCSNTGGQLMVRNIYATGLLLYY